LLLFLVINGLSIGAIYALIALGLVILLRSLNLFNFLQGEMVMGGAFLGVLFYGFLKLPFWASFASVLILMGFLGALVERLAINPLKNPTVNNMIVATLAAGIILQNIGLILGGPEPLILSSPVKGLFLMVAGQKISLHSLLVIGCAILLMILLQVFFKFTKTGICIRAVMADRQAARMMGIRVPRMITQTFAISSALGAASGILVGPITYVSYDMGSIAMKAFAAAIAGGMYSFAGAIIAGFCLGLVETLLTAYVSSAYRDVIAYAIIIAVLLLKPKGLFARE
jgi:branched-chain amino acid transport system permease protein